MKPQLIKVPSQLQHSFSVRIDSVPYFYNYWHYHPEVELIYIQKGRGTQFIGDSISNFREGDMLLVGSNLPHLWRCDEIYHQGNKDLKAEAVVIHFLPDFWGKSFMELREMFAIKNLLQKAGKGLSISGDTREQVMEQMKELRQAQMAFRISVLLRILQTLAMAPERELTVLSISDFQAPLGQADNQRLNQIYTFTLTNFSREIKLQELAELVSMNRLAFCRYFKSKTGKTYTQFLMEVRIGQVCKLLIEDKLSISQIAVDCGYNNYSNFTRQFKQIARLTPFEYRRKYVK